MGARRQWRHLSALSNNSSPPPPLLLFWLRVNWFALSLLPPHFLLLPPPPLPSIYYYFFLLFFCCFVFKKGAKGGRGGGGGGGGGRGGRRGRGGKKGNNSNNLSETCRLLGADSWAQNRTELLVCCVAVRRWRHFPPAAADGISSNLENGNQRAREWLPFGPRFRLGLSFAGLSTGNQTESITIENN